LGGSNETDQRGFRKYFFVAGLDGADRRVYLCHGSRGEVAFIVYLTRFFRFVGLFFFFLWELLMANLRVAYEVLTPGYQMRAAIIAIPLDANSDLEITVLANLITLTPGTLSLDVSADRKILYIHAMHVHDVEKFRKEIKVRLERRVMEVFK
jgi:multicomponent Na+:H+ antiporter subunit E